MIHYLEPTEPNGLGCWFVVVDSITNLEVSELVLLALLTGQFPKIVFTHGGRAHNDEIVGSSIFALVSNFLIIVRTRDEWEWQFGDHLIDVGGRYDGVRYYDHHQRNPPLPRRNGVKYATGGLVFRHFLLDWLKRVAGQYDVPYDQLAIAVDSVIIQGFDFNDTGRTLDYSSSNYEESRSGFTPKDPDPLNLISGRVNSPRWMTTEQRNQAFAKEVIRMAETIETKTHEIAESMTIPRRLELALRNASDPRILFLDCRPRKFDITVDRRFSKVERIVFEDVESYRVIAVKRGDRTIPFPSQWEENPPPGLAHLREDRLYLAAESLSDAYALARLSLETPFELTAPVHSPTTLTDEEEERVTFDDPNQYEVFSDSYG